MSAPVFSIRPNWRRHVLERLSWLTDVIESHNASEQRLPLRAFPRRMLEYEILATDNEARRLDALLWRDQARQYWLPIWTDPQLLAADLAAAATEIPAETAGFDFAAGEAAVLFLDFDAFELVMIDAVGPDVLTLSAPTVKTWLEGTRLYPARLARLPAGVKVKRETDAAVTATLQFEIANSAHAEEPDALTYRGLEVTTRRPNWIGGIPTSYERKIARLDYQLGAIAIDDLSELPEPTRTHEYLLEDRAAISSFRGWLHAREGRAYSFWSPQWQQDLVQIAPIGPADVELRVEALDYANAYDFDPNRRDIALRGPGDQWTFRRIVDVAPGEAGEEILTLDSPLGFAADPGDFRQITWLVRSRLEADAVELAWHTAGVAVCRLAFRGVRA